MWFQITLIKNFALCVRTLCNVLSSEILIAILNVEFSSFEFFRGLSIGEWMEFELGPLLGVRHSTDPCVNIVNKCFKNVFIWAKFKALLVSWEPLVKVRIIYVKMVDISKHQDPMIVCQVKSILSIMNISSVFIIVPLLTSFIPHKFFKITMNTRIVHKMIILNPLIILTGEHEIHRGLLHLGVKVKASVSLKGLRCNLLLFDLRDKLRWI